MGRPMRGGLEERHTTALHLGVRQLPVRSLSSEPPGRRACAGSVVACGGHTEQVQGPLFDYALVPELVAHRKGEGPIWVTWDTNILSVYETYGAAMWEGEDFEIEGTDPVEVEALGDLVSIWMWWDLRFIVLTASAQDSKKPRPAPAVARRAFAMPGIADALSLGLDGDGGEAPPRSTPLPRSVTDLLPNGYDRYLVATAHELGADVFMSMDRGVCRRDSDVRQYGMRCLRPSELVAYLVEAGVPAGWDPAALDWPAPDLGRMAALISAIEEEET